MCNRNVMYLCCRPVLQNVVDSGQCYGQRSRGRKGGKAQKERTTVGLFCNATGTDFWKTVFIGKSKRSRCFGKHWDPTRVGCMTKTTSLGCGVSYG